MQSPEESFGPLWEMQAHRSLRMVSWLGLAMLSLLTLNGCLNTPSSQQVNAVVALGIPDHSAFGTTPCETCHALDRPAPTIDPVTSAEVIHGGGRDCGECHVPGAPNWRTFVTFSHSPIPAACDDCHLASRPTAIVNNNMVHSYPGVGDCVACHAPGAGVTWANGTYAHDPLPGSCAECHSAQRPATVVNGFAHDVGGMGDCASCHHSVGVTWADGFFSHSPTPASCLDCHAGTRPTGPVGTPPFDHAVVGMGDCRSCHAVQSATKNDWTGGSFSHVPPPATCIDCHLGIRPVGLAGTPAFDHALGGTGDCVSCHQPKSDTQTDWSGALAFSHSPTPASCTECHAGDRPTGPVGTPAFDHSIAGMGDCKSCHALKSATKADWTGGTFSHVPAPATCIECHLAQRPLTVTSNGFDHSKGGTGDCAACHQNPGVTWAGAIAGYDHSTIPAGTRCDSCHAARRPAAAVNVHWDGPPPSEVQFWHSVMVTTDCKGCHLDPGGIWGPGTVYSHSPNPGQCSVCHVNQRPVGPVGPPQFDHAKGGSGDCSACHTHPGDRWSDGNFTHTSAITACATCHEYKRPKVPVGSPPFDHSISGTGDCKSCHAMKSATQTDWTGGVFTHVPKPTACATCHIAQKPAAAVRVAAVSTDGRTYQNDYLHSLIAGDCVSCHVVKSTTQTDWTRGTYSHNPVPASCTTCHAVTKPTVVVSGFDHSQAGLGDCKGCHAFPGQKWTGATAIPSSVILTPPSGKAWPNITAPHPVIDPAKTGLTCTTCHGTNTSARIIAYDHAKPVTGSKCVYCHYTGQTETSFPVITKSHESASNTKDCNVSGCHRPKIYPTWQATTRTFSQGEWGSP